MVYGHPPPKKILLFYRLVRRIFEAALLQLIVVLGFMYVSS